MLHLTAKLQTRIAWVLGVDQRRAMPVWLTNVAAVSAEAEGIANIWPAWK